MLGAVKEPDRERGGGDTHTLSYSGWLGRRGWRLWVWESVLTPNWCQPSRVLASCDVRFWSLCLSYFWEDENVSWCLSFTLNSTFCFTATICSYISKYCNHIERTKTAGLVTMSDAPHPPRLNCTARHCKCQYLCVLSNIILFPNHLSLSLSLHHFLHLPTESFRSIAGFLFTLTISLIYRVVV